jgi:hypothetical protein
MLSSILEPQREEIREEWKKLHIEELHNLYYSRNITGVIVILTADSIGNTRNPYEILV